VNEGWKPVTLQAPLLLSIAVFTVCAIFILEDLSQTGLKNGGIIFATGDLSSAATFSYLYLPTIVSVLYGMSWSWVDLDAKRLEPYFQMSKVGGALAHDSLDLCYPFDFVGWAPIKAIRRR